jgi:hypothetical protein
LRLERVDFRLQGFGSVQPAPRARTAAATPTFRILVRRFSPRLQTLLAKTCRRSPRGGVWIVTYQRDG